MRADVTSAFARGSVKSPVVQLADGTWINYIPCDALTPPHLYRRKQGLDKIGFHIDGMLILDAQ
jgi:hypothetical protein